MTTTVQAKTQQQIVNRFVEELWNNKRIDLINDLFASDVTLHWRDETRKGREAIKNICIKWQKAFPDLRHTIDEILYSDGKVVLRWHGTGTHLGIFNDVPPTRKKINYSGVTIFQIENGKIKEAWVSADILQVLQCLGIITEKK